MAEMLQESGHYRDCAHKHIHGVCCSCKYNDALFISEQLQWLQGVRLQKVAEKICRNYN